MGLHDGHHAEPRPLLSPPYYVEPVRSGHDPFKPRDPRARRRDIGQARRIAEAIGKPARGARRRAALSQRSPTDSARNDLGAGR